ncbi:hypothetical protein FGIG_03381 [Fasciola gigantica]|uniref:TTI1 N-terminal TPR domain-containing protein n=1 Tax=Fasciola gigantica TaxID=46835 RepID=A0A504YIL2_FASGI|nr:hypothetical protein FGIG_03381 [Fasciola gigantica]
MSFAMLGTVNDKNWRRILEDLELSLKNCECKGRTELFNLIHPTLLRFLSKDEDLKSDKIDNVFRIYCITFAQWQDVVSPVVYSDVLEELSAILFRLSCLTNKSNLPWSCLSEECCLTIVQTIHISISASAQKSQGISFYPVKNLPLLSHICSTLLEMSEFASWRAVRLKALQTLGTLFHPWANISKHYDPRVRETVAHFLPGVCQTLYRIVTGDQKVGSLVKKTAFDAWSACLTVVFTRQENARLSTACPDLSGESILLAFAPVCHHA